MLKKLSLLAIAVFFTLGACLPLPSEAWGKEPVEPMVPRRAFAPAASFKSGPIELIAKKFVSFDPAGLVLTPTNPLVSEALETSDLISLTIPEDKKRTHFFISTGVLHSWEQIASTANYRLTSTIRIRLTSSALPAPGEIDFGLGMEGQLDGQPSTANTARIRDHISSFGLDDEILVFLLKNDFPSLTDEQALQTARSLIASGLSITMKVRVGVRSVSEFVVTNAFLQVWGD
jgi:hypothetical protein